MSAIYMMAYSITTKYRTGEDNDGRPWNDVGDCGDFRSTVDFRVTDKGRNTSGVNGIIVQLIKKSTIVDVYDDEGGGKVKTLTTSEQISDYTGGNVKFMNYNYLEYFEVQNGESVDGDQFGNGPVCEYDQSEPIIDDEQDMSHGIINQKGYAVFIPSPVSDQIKTKLKWNSELNTPANGLPMLPFDAKTWNDLFQARRSHVYVHTLLLEWKYLNILEQDRSINYTDNCKEMTQITGSQQTGGGKKRRRNKGRKTKKHKN
jgi:hypothetical protein